jgi:tetratricopeptide (TPR) repeat protein
LERALGTLRGGPPGEMVDARGLYLAGVIRYRLGDAAGADAAVHVASSLAPAYPSVTGSAATYFVRRYVETQGAHPDALALAVESLRRLNASSPNPHTLVRSMNLLEEVPGGSAHLETIGPPREWAAVLVAQHHARNGRPADGLRVLERFSGAGRGPVDARTQRELADLRDQTGDVSGAARARVDHVMALAPEARPSAAAALVSQLSGAGRHGDASMFVRALRRRAPDEPAALRAEAEFALRSREYAQAYNLLARSVAAVPSADDHFALATLAEKLRRPREAEQHISRAIDLRPNVAAYWSARAELRAKSDNAALAIQDFQTALAVSPKDDRLRSRLSAMLTDARRMGELIALWRAAAAERPNDAFVHEHLARALFAAGEFEGAVGHARRAVELDPKRASALELLRRIDAE